MNKLTPKLIKNFLFFVLIPYIVMVSVFMLNFICINAADSSNDPITFSPPPLLFGEGIGAYDFVSHSLVLQCLDYAITNTPEHSGDCWVVMPSLNGDSVHHISVMCPKSGINTGDFRSNFDIHYYVSYDFDLSGNKTYEVQNASFGCYVSQIFETINGQSFYKSGYVYYPLYVYKPDLYLNSNGVQIFAETEIPIGPSGHTKGGVLSNYVDSTDIIEGDSELPDVDTTAPADPSNNSSWFQKILNGIGKLNQSVKGGVLTIGDYIGQLGQKLQDFVDPYWDNFTDKVREGVSDVKDAIDDLPDNLEGFFNRVGDKIDSAKDKLNDILGVINGIADTDMSDACTQAWLDGFNNCPAKSIFDVGVLAINDLKGFATSQGYGVNISRGRLTLTRGNSSSSPLIMSINTANTALDSGVSGENTYSVDFSWYEQIREDYLWLFIPWVYVGALILFVKSIPSIFNGGSGMLNVLSHEPKES